MRDGLVVVAQQLIFPTKERLDLLCIENRSRWLIVELKRDRMAREVAAQALDYVSLLTEMSTEDLDGRLAPHLAGASEDVRELVRGLLDSEDPDSPREVSAVVVGTSADEALLRITRHLSEQYGVPLSVVELQGFETPSGDHLILREETGTDPTADARADQPGGATSEEERWARVQSYADATGFGRALAEVRRILQDSPVYLRPYTRSVMVAPPSNRSRYLAVFGFSGPRRSRGAAALSYEIEPFLEFYPSLDSPRVTAALGPTHADIGPDQLVAFAGRLADLVAGDSAPPDGTELPAP
ncbi:hypothetical protein [Arthrobacter sp. NEB 688]|uniref:hypothetical protein n=1 Tax=Arthrobacter sp. NEB 688 TaxID=904039 RepID=UPI002570E3E7|nr:hypothetical protein [Arthrobacter sp. NEB 688]